MSRSDVLKDAQLETRLTACKGFSFSAGQDRWNGQGGDGRCSQQGTSEVIVRCRRVDSLTSGARWPKKSSLNLTQSRHCRLYCSLTLTLFFHQFLRFLAFLHLRVSSEGTVCFAPTSLFLFYSATRPPSRRHARAKLAQALHITASLPNPNS